MIYYVNISVAGSVGLDNVGERGRVGQSDGSGEWSISGGRWRWSVYRVEGCWLDGSVMGVF